MSGTAAEAGRAGARPAGDGAGTWSRIDEAAKVYGEHREMMLRVARRYLGEAHEAAEDVVQEAAIRLLRTETEFRSSRIGAGLSTRDAALEWIRDRGRGKRDATRDERLDPADRRHQGKALSAEREAMGRIELAEVSGVAPPSVMALAAGYSLREIARASGRTETAVGSEVCRWRQRQER